MVTRPQAIRLAAKLARQLSLLPLMILFQVTYAAPGDLDTSFGTGGIVTTSTATDSEAYGLRLLPNGGMLVGGSTYDSHTNMQQFAVGRYTSNGSVDTSFGSGGTATALFFSGLNSAAAYAMEVQADGKIILAGATQFDGVSSKTQTAIARFNADGTLDGSFGTRGTVVTPIASIAEQYSSIAVQADGKIVAAGNVKIGNNDQAVIARYNTNGALDAGFGSAGIVKTPVSGSDVQANRVVIQADGKLVVSGNIPLSDGTGRGFVFRYNTDGSLDSTFGIGGMVSVPVLFANSNMSVNALLRQPDGKLVCAGAATLSNGKRGFALARLNADGSPDIGFGSGGLATTAIGNTADVVFELALQADGKLVAGGRSLNSSSVFTFAMARYLSNGALDTSMGSSGVVRTAIGSIDDEIEALVIAPDGKLIVAGLNQIDRNSNYKFAVARYLGDSSSMTGLWWNETESGWGMSVTQHGSMVFAATYTYDQAGLPTWYVLPSCPVNGYSCSGPIYKATGGTPPVVAWNGAGKVVTPVGTGTLSFANANNGTFSFTIDGATSSKPINRQIFASGLTSPATDFSDVWWNSNESGWGIALTQQYSTSFATWYAYDASGNAVWYVASNCPMSGSGCTGDLYKVTGGARLTAAWVVGKTSVTKVGSISFAFTDASNGTVNYSINGVAGSRSITRQSF